MDCLIKYLKDYLAKYGPCIDPKCGEWYNCVLCRIEMVVRKYKPDPDKINNEFSQ